jgi:hypothetical protein
MFSSANASGGGPADRAVLTGTRQRRTLFDLTVEGIRCTIIMDLLYVALPGR